MPRHNLRDPLSRRFIRAPVTDKRIAPLLEAEFVRYVAGLLQRLRYEYAKRHHIQVARIPFTVRLALKALAHASAKLEVLEERHAHGVVIDDGLLHRLLCEQSRRLKQLGLAEAVTKPPPPKPVPSLAQLVRQQQAAR